MQPLRHVRTYRIEVNSGQGSPNAPGCVHAGLSAPRRPRGWGRGRGAGRGDLQGSVVPSVLTPCVDILGGTAMPCPPRNHWHRGGSRGRDCVVAGKYKKVRWVINQD